jgi:hypothetical protein
MRDGVLVIYTETGVPGILGLILRKKAYIESRALYLSRDVVNILTSL